MKKNVMNDIADDVKEVIISKTNGEFFLVTKEEIFQATSKSDKGGIRQFTGYTEFRISSYDINTGKLSKRIVLGDRKDNECTFLGQTESNLWYKSVDKKLGFHAREPKNLEIIVSQEKITEINPVLKDNLSQPEWNSIQNCYGFDIDKNMPMVSDNSGFVYYIDPVTLKAEKTSESIKRFNFENNCLSTSVKFDANSTIYLKGSPRNYIDIFNKEIKDISFLKGNFLESSNMINLSDAATDFFAPYKKEIEKFKKEIDSIKMLIESADTASTGGKNNYSQFNLKYAKRNIRYLEDRIKHTADNMKRNSSNDNYDLITRDNGVFLLSQTDVSDKATDIITKVRINSDTTVTQQWQTELRNIYRDPDKGMDRSSFEVVFSKGNPNLRTMRALMGDNKLVFVSMLNAVCLDEKTGKILWSMELK